MAVESKIQSQQLYAPWEIVHTFSRHFCFKWSVHFSHHGSSPLNAQREAKANSIEAKASHLDCIKGIFSDLATSFALHPLQSIHHTAARILFIKWKSEHIICSKLCSDSPFHAVKIPSPHHGGLQGLMQSGPCSLLRPLLFALLLLTPLLPLGPLCCSSNAPHICLPWGLCASYFLCLDFHSPDTLWFTLSLSEGLR